MPVQIEPGQRPPRRRPPVPMDPWQGFGLAVSLYKKNPAYVRDLQRTLRASGFYRGAVDGIWGKQTEAAYRLWVAPLPGAGLDTSYGAGAFARKLAAARKYEAEVKRVSAQLKKQYAQLNTNLARLQRTGDVTPLDKYIALNKFWADARMLAGGAFASIGNEAYQRQRYLENLRTSALAERSKVEQQLADQQRQANSLKGKALRFVGAAVNAKGPAGGALRGLIAGASFPHEIVNQAFYGGVRLRQLGGLGLGNNRYVGAAAALSALGGRRFLPKNVQAALAGIDSPEERQKLRDAGKLLSAGEYYSQEIGKHFGLAVENPKNTLPAKLLDVAYNFIDPTIGVGGLLRAATVVSDGAKAAIALEKAPASVEALTKAVAQAAARASARELAPGLGDAKLLQRLARGAGLGEKHATELAGALVDREGDRARAYLTQLSSRMDETKQGGQFAKALAEDALSDLKRLGMTDEVRQAILKASLGWDWKPRIGLAFRLAAGTAVKASKFTLVQPVAEAGLRAMPRAVRATKTRSLADLIARSTKGKGVTKQVGLLESPNFKKLINFAARSKAEKDEATALLGVFKGKKMRADVRLKGLAARIDALPDSELKDVLRQRAEVVAEAVTDHLDRQKGLLTPAQQRLMRKTDVQLRDELAKLKKGLKAKAAPLDAGDRRRLESNLRDEREKLEGFRARLAKGGPVEFADALVGTPSVAEVQQWRRKRIREITAEVERLKKELSRGAVAAQAPPARVEDIKAVLAVKGQKLDKDLTNELALVERESVQFAKLKPVTYAHAVYNFNSEMRDYAYMSGLEATTRAGVGARAVRAVTRAFNDVPLTNINLWDTAERTKTFRDWAVALGLNADEANGAYSRMAVPMTGEEALKVARSLKDELLAKAAVQAGLSEGEAEEMVKHILLNEAEFRREMDHWSAVADDRSRRWKPSYDKVYSVDGAHDAVVMSQRQYNLAMVDPYDVRRYIQSVKARRSALANIGFQVRTLGARGVDLYRPLHGAFKFAVLVLNAPRYIMRVAVMSERMRSWLDHGFAGLLAPPGRIVRRLNNGMLDTTAGVRWATGFEEVGLENVPMHLLDKKAIQIVGHGLIDQGGRGFVENLWHVLMFQVRPEDDLLHSVLMPHLWNPDEAARKAAKESAVEALETTEAGRVYLEKAIMMDRKNADTALLVDKVEKWLRQVMPNQAIVDKRLGGQFTMKELGANPEWHPTKIWGDRYERLFKVGASYTENLSRWKKLAGHLTFQSPTANWNRQPFYWREFNLQFDALTTSGMKATAATELASRQAVWRTNDILFDASVRSRFAKKYDLLFPFQQAREEELRVMSRLVREHPDRALKTLQLLAAAFNAGEDKGVFTKDRFGNWSAKVPGSAALSRAFADWAPEWVPFRAGLKAAGRTDYTFSLRSLLFTQDLWATTPRPGGPWFTVLSYFTNKLHPEWFPDGGAVQKYLFNDFSPTGLFFSPSTARLWIALTGESKIPWEPFTWTHIGLGETPGERLRDRLVGEVGAQLIYDRLKNGEDMPTAQEIADAVRANIFMYGLLGSVVPASIYPAQPGREEFEAAQKYYVRPDGSFDFRSFSNAHPEMVGFMTAQSKDAVRADYADENGYVSPEALERLKREHPEYYERWRRSGGSTESLRDRMLQVRDYLTPEEFTERVNESREYSQALYERNLIFHSGLAPYEKAVALSDWQKKFGGAYERGMRDYHRDQDFDAIMAMPPAIRDSALRDWQYRYNVSPTVANRLRKEWDEVNPTTVAPEVEKLDFGFDAKTFTLKQPTMQARYVEAHKNLWTEARNTQDLYQLWQREGLGQGLIAWARQNLTPAERANLLAYAMATATDIQDYNDLRAERARVLNMYGNLLFKTGKGRLYGDIESEAEKFWKGKTAQARDAMEKKYDQIAAISAEQKKLVDAAKGKKGAEAHAIWTRYFALKDRKTRLYAEVKGIKNALYRHYPDLKNIHQEVHFLRVTNEFGWKAIQDEGLDHYGIPWLLSDEELGFNNMPPHIRQDYVHDLMERLSVPVGQFVSQRGESSLKWDYLTDFQQDLLYANLGKRQVDALKRMSAAREKAEAGGFGGRWHIGDNTLGHGFGELAFAIEQFKVYNKRGNMPEPTQELKEFKALGNNEVLKAQYLKTHPRLQQWFRLGPMAQMPAALAVIVHHIMVKWGRWEGNDGGLSWDDVSELAFAKGLLEKYNKRRGNAPAAYERWVNMPTGPERFKYMQAHPEIERWLQAGPMANMPQEYREVVRDIMTKFGEWTDRQDPLSHLLDQYYATPQYARQQFLEDHPEIIAYWRAIRTGRDRQLFDLAQNYFALQDPDLKRQFLDAHPELQEYFIQERQRRYQAFLNNVARYLGQVPELAEAYLADQTRFIKELVAKFGERPLVAPTVVGVHYRRPEERRVRSNRRERVRSS